MLATTPIRRRVALTAVTALTLAIGVVHAPPASAGTGVRAKLLRLINASRERHDLQTVELDTSLSDEARKHTRKMLRRNRVFDPTNLQEILSGYPWDDLGAAAVGCAGSVNKLHEALMDSKVHRAIMLHPDLRNVGIGVIRADEENICGRGSVWVTDIFYG